MARSLAKRFTDYSRKFAEALRDDPAKILSINVNDWDIRHRNSAQGGVVTALHDTRARALQVGFLLDYGQVFVKTDPELPRSTPSFEIGPHLDGVTVHKRMDLEIGKKKVPFGGPIEIIYDSRGHLNKVGCSLVHSIEEQAMIFGNLDNEEAIEELVERGRGKSEVDCDVHGVNVQAALHLVQKTRGENATIKLALTIPRKKSRPGHLTVTLFNCPTIVTPEILFGLVRREIQTHVGNIF